MAIESAVLAYLYRKLCRVSLDSATEISGPITLLQLWSWERLHVGQPDFGRPPVPIVVPHVHDDVVDGLHDHLLLDEALCGPTFFTCAPTRLARLAFY
ncbi:hypothetical protein VitviT2T_024714 [Vitis vinifera]|uniref:Aminotransferase-like plant mobile domain-containing protein n=1 Tax=Vitis vinifera TaxID=29760 RepID=A0ABY9DGH0_VITVI|nr:hypothetical protein VitviT2T_024714 [Vitis vinifera]